MWNLKHDTNKLIYKTENRLTDIENRLAIAKGEGRWGRAGLGPCRILVPQPGTEFRPLAVKAWSPNTGPPRNSPNS